MGRVEPSQGPVDQITIGYAVSVVGRREIDGQNVNLDRAPPTPAGLVEAGVHEEPMQPGVEAVGITKPRQVAPRPHERVLDRVAREFAVPKDEACGTVETGRSRRCKQGEGVVIASPRPLDELPSLHGPSPNVPADVAGFEGYGVAGARIGSQIHACPSQEVRRGVRRAGHQAPDRQTIRGRPGRSPVSLDRRPSRPLRPSSGCPTSSTRSA